VSVDVRGANKYGAMVRYAVEESTLQITKVNSDLPPIALPRPEINFRANSESPLKWTDIMSSCISSVSRGGFNDTRNRVSE
jgi:hypothetical protein